MGFLSWDFISSEVLKHLNFGVVNLYSVVLPNELREINPYILISGVAVTVKNPQHHCIHSLFVQNLSKEKSPALNLAS